MKTTQAMPTGPAVKLAELMPRQCEQPGKSISLDGKASLVQEFQGQVGISSPEMAPDIAQMQLFPKQREHKEGLAPAEIDLSPTLRSAAQATRDAEFKFDI